MAKTVEEARKQALLQVPSLKMCAIFRTLSHHSRFISWDRVHLPNDVGHTAPAMAFFRAMEFDFEA